MSTKTQIIGGSFQDSEGNLLINGYLKLKLSQDSSVTGVGNICSGVEITLALDSDGSVASSTSTPPAANQFMWANDVLVTPNTFYRVTGYTAKGQPAWGPNNQQITSGGAGGGTFDVGTWVPNQVFSWTPPTTPVRLQNNGVDNTSQTILNLESTDGSVVITDEGGGAINLQSTGSKFQTSGKGWFAGPGMTELTALFTLAVSAFVNANADNSLLVYQFTLESSWTISNCSWQVTSAGSAGDKVMFGIYDAGKNLLLGTTFDGSITTLQTNSFSPVTFPPGVYYFVQSDSTSAGTRGPVVQLGSNVTTPALNMLGTSIPITSIAANSASAGVLPATLGALTAQTSITASSGIALPVWRV